MANARVTLLTLALLAVPAVSSATTGGPNSFQVLGVDTKAGKVLLKENVGGESGEVRAWTLDLKSPAAPPVVAPVKPNEGAPAGLEAPKRLALNEIQLSGQIVGQSLAPLEEQLLHRFDLKVELSWNQAKAAIDLVAYRTAGAKLVDSWLLPGDRCALALVSTMGKPEEGGYELQRPVLVCSETPRRLPKLQPPVKTPLKRPGQ